MAVWYVVLIAVPTLGILIFRKHTLDITVEETFMIQYSSPAIISSQQQQKKHQVSEYLNWAAQIHVL